MKEPDYTVCTISMEEVQQLFLQNNHPVFLVLYQPGPIDKSGMSPETAGAAFFQPVITANTGNAREQMLADYLHRLGIPAHLKGYEYLKRGVEIAMENPSILCAITKELYPDIARSCGSSSVCVERAIRHAIENAWNRGCLQLQDDLFGTTAGILKEKPTNSEFIAIVAEKLRLHESSPAASRLFPGAPASEKPPLHEAGPSV